MEGVSGRALSEGSSIGVHVASAESSAERLAQLQDARRLGRRTIDKILRLVRNVRAEVTTNNRVPRGAVLFVKLCRVVSGEGGRVGRQRAVRIGSRSAARRARWGARAESPDESGTPRSPPPNSPFLMYAAMSFSILNFSIA